jgi:hypothetical protein
MREFTKDYRILFKEAVETHNTFRMVELFEALCNEVDISDPEGEKARVEAAKAIADRFNTQDRESVGKKI